MQCKIASFVWLVYTEGIPEAENCNVAGNSSTFNPLSKTITNFLSLYVGVIGQSSNEDEPTSVASLSSNECSLKRPKLNRRELQNEEIVQAEREIKSAVTQIKDEFRTTNAILLD